MDSLLTTGELARELRTSIPRVHRAVRDGIIRPVESGSRRLLFRCDAISVLRRRWGWCPELRGLSREEAFVLAALSRRPLGMRSNRAVARAAHVSPTTAQRVLRELRRRGYVGRRSVRVAEGRAKDAEIWEVRWGSTRWLRVASRIGRCELPVEDDEQEVGVPRRLAHLFWNVRVSDLDPVRHGRYIADRILRDGDAQGLAWLARRAVPSEAIAAAAEGRGLDPRRAALGRALTA